MDDGFSIAVREVFVRLHKQDLIYQGDYIINWCPRCGTALSDDEVEHQDEKGKLWHLRYPLADDPSRFVEVATTRPETMLGDTGVAVHPTDERYSDIIGKMLLLPIVDREIPIVADEHVDPSFGTGAVKVTPAHDPNDFEIGNRHNLPRIKAFDEKGIMLEYTGPRLAGKDRYEARDEVLKIFNEMDLLGDIAVHDHAVGHCYRCDTVIEPFLSNQWFVRMKPLAEPAIAAVRRGLVTFHPDRWTGVYFNWMENIRDWCISRQLWWGHRMPVYWCNDCGKYTVSVDKPEKCEHCESESLRQDPNVLDTWFSSWLWPFATMGWPDYDNPDLRAFFPTDTLSTANEIIFFWVARMIMASVHFNAEVPFSDVYIHGTVRDDKGRKMSKSLGNGIDPLDVIDQYGRDALRFTMLYQAAAGQDIFLAIDSFEEGRNFTNKLWNASRLILLNIKGSYSFNELISKTKPTALEDRYILSRLQRTKKIVNKAIAEFNLAEAIKAIYGFFWNEYCSWYLEMIKPRFDSEDKDVEVIALGTLLEIIHMLQPFTPFIAEELFQLVKKDGLVTDMSESITISPFPVVNDTFIDEVAENQFEVFSGIVASVRNIKASFGIANKKTGELNIVTRGNESEFLVASSDLIARLARLDEVRFADEKPKIVCGSAVVSGIEIYLPLGDIIDIDKETTRLQKDLDHANSMIKASEKKLANPSFVDRAPEVVVEREKKKLADNIDKRNTIEKQIKDLTT
jgi:valyl-tRNA synthetase